MQLQFIAVHSLLNRRAGEWLALLSTHHALHDLLTVVDCTHMLFVMQGDAVACGDAVNIIPAANSDHASLNGTNHVTECLRHVVQEHQTMSAEPASAAPSVAQAAAFDHPQQGGRIQTPDDKSNPSTAGRESEHQLGWKSAPEHLDSKCWRFQQPNLVLDTETGKVSPFVEQCKHWRCHQPDLFPVSEAVRLASKGICCEALAFATAKRGPRMALSKALSWFLVLKMARSEVFVESFAH